MANEFPASRSDTPLQQVPAAPYPCGPVAWVSLDARGRASSARTREGVQPANASEVRISAPTEPLPWRRSTAILAKPTDHGSQTAKFGLGQYQYVAAQQKGQPSEKKKLGTGQRRAGRSATGYLVETCIGPGGKATKHGPARYRTVLLPPMAPFFSFCALSLFFFVTSRPPFHFPPGTPPRTDPLGKFQPIWS